MSALCEIDVSKLEFAVKDGKFARTTLDGALPKFKLGSVDAPCRAPFGISTPFSGDDAELRRTMDLEINPDDLAPLARIDEAVVAAGVENSEKWFGRELNEAAVRAMHTPIVIPPKKQEYAPTVRTKVNIATTEQKHTRTCSNWGGAGARRRASISERRWRFPSNTNSDDSIASCPLSTTSLPGCRLCTPLPFVAVAGMPVFVLLGILPRECVGE